MEAKQNSITRFIQQQDAQFYIPVYQRNYAWKQEHCQQLLWDIKKVGLNSKSTSHFIGSIVYIQQNLITGSPELTIIDGQQRLTTLTLLIAALARRAKESGNPDFARKLYSRFLINEDLNENEKLKLKPIKKDEAALKHVLYGEGSNFNEYSKIVENFNFFYENIPSNEIENVYNGFQKLIFIEIGLDKSADEPQKIFQSLNSTGLDLSPADLIRNYILMGHNHRTQTKIYENYWVEIENNTTESISKTNRMSDFIRDYLTFKFNSIPIQAKVFDVFKEKYVFETEEDLIEVLEDLKRYSRFYNLFINPDSENDNNISYHLKSIRKLQINVSYPFLLQVFQCHSENKITTNELIEVLEIIQSYVWRRFICGVATNALNKIFMDLYKDIDESNFVESLYKSLIKRKGSQRYPNNDEVNKELEVKNMYEIQPKNRNYFLERLENYGFIIQNNIDNNQEVTIEHIFPQNPSKEWKNELGEDFEIMKTYSNTAANLTLSAFNRELSNSPFLVKRDLPEKGYKFSNLKMDKFLAELDKWDLESLKKRQNWIFERFIQIWKYPEIEIPINTTEEINILDFDPQSATGEILEYFIFFDTKYEKPSWTEMLIKVAVIMFEREPHQFISSSLSQILQLTTNPESLSRSVKVSQSYYIGTGLSASVCVKRIQMILDTCDTDDELIICLKKSI